MSDSDTPTVERISPDDMAWLMTARRAEAEALANRVWTQRVVITKYKLTPADRLAADGTIQRAAA